jgi:protein-arginine kinase activator protein McsA
MNSNRKIEVDMTFCEECQQTFFEFRDYELEYCPHCKADFYRGKCNVETTLEIEFEVDFKTGKINILNGLGE